MSLPTITLEGRLLEEPEFQFLHSGRAMARMQLVAEKFQHNPNTNKFDVTDSTEITATAFGKTAENIVESLRKGDLVTVSGELKMSRVSVESGTVTRYGVVAHTVGVSIRFRQTPHSRDVAKAEPREGSEPYVQVAQAAQEQEVRKAQERGIPEPDDPTKAPF